MTTFFDTRLVYSPKPGGVLQSCYPPGMQDNVSIDIDGVRAWEAQQGGPVRALAVIRRGSLHWIARHLAEDRDFAATLRDAFGLEPRRDWRP